MLPTIRTDWTVLAPSTEAKKSVVSRPSPLSLDAFGSLVAKRRPNAGRDAVSAAIRILVPMTMSSTLDVVSPVAVTMPDNGAGSRERDAQPIVEPAIDLDLGNGAEPRR